MLTNVNGPIMMPRKGGMPVYLSNSA